MLSCIVIIFVIVAIGYFGYKYFFSSKTVTKECLLKTEENKVSNTDLAQMAENGVWPLLVFVQLHGKMKIRTELGKNNQKTLRECLFISSKGETISTYIARTLQKCTIKQIEEKKEDLVIVQLESGHLCLCESWSDVPLE